MKETPQQSAELFAQLREQRKRIEFLEREIKRLRTPQGVAELIENLSLSDLDDIGVTVTV